MNKLTHKHGLNFSDIKGFKPKRIRVILNTLNDNATGLPVLRVLENDYQDDIDIKQNSSRSYSLFFKGANFDVGDFDSSFRNRNTFITYNRGWAEDTKTSAYRVFVVSKTEVVVELSDKDDYFSNDCLGIDVYNIEDTNGQGLL